MAMQLLLKRVMDYMPAPLLIQMKLLNPVEWSFATYGFKVSLPLFKMYSFLLS